MSTSTLDDTAAPSISVSTVAASAGSIESSHSKPKAETSEPNPDERFPSSNLEKFGLALSQWAVESCISQSQFEGFLDALGTLKSYKLV